MMEYKAICELTSATFNDAVEILAAIEWVMVPHSFCVNSSFGFVCVMQYEKRS